MAYRVEEVTWSKAKRQLCTVREKVFICELRIPRHIEFDHHDPDARHLLLIEDDNPAGTLRIHSDGRLSRLAVILNKRTPDRVQSLLSHAQQLAGKMGLTQIYFDCELHHCEQLKSAGLEPLGRVFMDVGIAKQTLVCPIDRLSMAPLDILH